MESKLIFAVLIATSVILLAMEIESSSKPTMKEHFDTLNIERVTETRESWTNLTQTISSQLKFYVYHVTNPDAVELGANPIFEEKGPYVYDQQGVKENVLERSGSVFYNERKNYFFNEEESIGPDTDEYNVVNVAFVSVLDSVNKGFPTLIEGVVNYIGNQSHSVIMRGVSVRDLTFDGYDISAFNHPLLTGSYPPEFTDDWRFGLYETKNGTIEGYYQISSGEDSSSRVGEIIEWNHKTNLEYWSDACNEISGTNGQIFAPDVTEATVLRVFDVEMCRSMYLIHIGDAEIREISGLRFSTPSDILEDPRTNEANRCFCLQANISECDYGGVLDVSPCRGMPMVMSAPHFLAGHPMYQDQTGLVPDTESHGTFITVEPISGVLLSVNKRMQMNIRLTPYDTPGDTIFSNVPEMIFPILWTEEIFTLSEEAAEELKGKLPIPTPTPDGPSGGSKTNNFAHGIFFVILGITVFKNIF